MPYTPITQPLTELEAVNLMLAAGGEGPVASIVGQRPDVTTATSLLRQAAREVQSKRWRFNTEFGYEVAPSGTLEWTDTADRTVTLNVFTPPPGLKSFAISAHPSQQGSLYLDAALMPSRKYNGGGTLVFYDRARNRDGWTRDYLYIDPQWLWDFEKLPDEARTYIALKATRRYLTSVVGDPALASQYAPDENTAFIDLQRVHGEDDDYNVFNNVDVSTHRGGRVGVISGVIDGRSTRGPA
jgi:hypothetical protein